MSSDGGKTPGTQQLLAEANTSAWAGGAPADSRGLADRLVVIDDGDQRALRRAGGLASSPAATPAARRSGPLPTALRSVSVSTRRRARAPTAAKTFGLNHADPCARSAR